MKTYILKENKGFKEINLKCNNQTQCHFLSECLL